MVDFINNVLAGSPKLSVSSSGVEISKTWIIKGVVGDQDNRIINAVFNGGIIPKRGTPYPSSKAPALGLIADTIDCKPIIGNTNFEITVVYRLPSSTVDSQLPPNDDAPINFQFSSATASVTTNRDNAGNTIIVEFIVADPIAQTSTVVQQGGTVEKQIKTMGMAGTRRESQSPAIRLYNPTTRELDFLGDVNAKDTILGGVAWPRAVWMCTGIPFTSSDNFQTFDVTYEFQYNADTWDATVVYIDPETGRPPSTVTVGDGIKTGIKMYNEVNFQDLKLG